MVGSLGGHGIEGKLHYVLHLRRVHGCILHASERAISACLPNPRASSCTHACARALTHACLCALMRARARALYQLGCKPCQPACQRPCVCVTIAHSMRLRVCARTRGKRGKGRGRWPRRGMRRVCVCGCGGLFTRSQSSNISLSLMSIRSSLNWVRRVCHPARSPRLCVHGCHAQELGALNAITFRRFRRSSK